MMEPAAGAGRGGRQGGAGGRGRAGQAAVAPSVRTFPGLTGIPMLYVTAENSNRTQGPAIVEALKASGAAAEHVYLRDRDIRGNGHLAMLENNRKQISDLLRAWIEQRVTA